MKLEAQTWQNGNKNMKKFMPNCLRAYQMFKVSGNFETCKFISSLFLATDSTSFSSCGDQCNELSSPRSLGLRSEDEDVQSKAAFGVGNFAFKIECKF